MNYKTVLVTGASAGFGLATARLLANNGYKVIALARREDKLKELSSLSDNIYPVAMDVTDAKAVETLVSSLPDGFKDIDVIVNNAGLALGVEKAQECSLENWKTMVDTNVLGVLNVTHTILPSLVKKNKGFIINLGSTAGSWPYVGGNVYGATKAFVEQFSRNLRTDVQGSAIKVTVIKPGLCSDTEFSYVRLNGNEKKVNDLYSGTKSILPEDIANTILWLLNNPAHVNVNEIEMMPVCQAYGGLKVVKDLDFTEKK